LLCPETQPAPPARLQSLLFEGLEEQDVTPYRRAEEVEDVSSERRQDNLQPIGSMSSPDAMPSRTMD